MIIVVVGPTGVGKTDLSINLAIKYNAEIINADSMQIYKDMDIATAKIKEEEMMGIKHHMLDIKTIDEDYSVYDYQIDARKILDNLIKKNKNIVIVGGTGLYIKALLYNYEFKKENIKNEYDELSNEELLKRIKEFDKEVDVHVNNRKRLVRLLNKYSNNNFSKVSNKLIYDNLIFIGLTTNRKELYKRIDLRVDKMISEGLVEEARNFYDKQIDCKALNTAIGYKELNLYFNNRISLEESIELIKKRSRHYAKRQYTWFHNQMKINWFDVDYNDFDKTIIDVNLFIDKYK